MFIDQEDPAFNLTLEILKGCGFSCQDCAIDKTLTSDFIQPGDETALIQLVNDMRDEGYRLHEFTIGPTDIISSKNGMSVLTSPLVWKLAERYESMTVSLALLMDQDLVSFAEKIDTLMADKKFRLIVPCTLKNAANPKYVDMLRRRIAIIKDNLHLAEFKLVYLTVNMVNASAENFSFATNNVIQNLDLGVETLVEYAFPHSRKGLKNIIVQQEFLRDFKFFTDGMKECKDTNRNRFLIPTLSDSLEATYHQGELYYTPVLMEKFPIFHEDFIVPRPWHGAGFIERKMDNWDEILMNYSHHPECGDCCFFQHCARGDVQVIMDHMNHHTCLLDMKNRYDLNPFTNPVRPDE